MQILPVKEAHASPQILKSYEAVLGTMGGPHLEAAVVDHFRSALAWERLFVFHGGWDHEATLRVASYEPSLAPIMHLYRRDYMKSDPLRRAVSALDGGLHAVALRLEPSDIPDEGYRRQFFEECGIVERVSILQRSDHGWRGVNIARHRRAGPCSDEELSTLAGLGLLLLPLVERHFAPQDLPHAREGLTEIERRFQQFFPTLTGRERQVCARAALGMSVEATALDLGIGRASVLTYRRRAYERLHVTSPYELAALILH